MSGKIEVVGPRAITLPTRLGGNDDTYGLVLVCATRKIFVEDIDDDTVQLRGITDRTLLTVDRVKLLVGLGCEIKNYLAYFEIDDITAEVPATFPNRTHMVLSDPEDPESGVETVHTWETWGANPGGIPGDDLPKQVGDKWYRTSRDRNNDGDYIPASAWVPASLSGLVVLESLPEVA